MEQDPARSFDGPFEVHLGRLSTLAGMMRAQIRSRASWHAGYRAAHSAVDLFFARRREGTSARMESSSTLCLCVVGVSVLWLLYPGDALAACACGRGTRYGECGMGLGIMLGPDLGSVSRLLLVLVLLGSWRWGRLTMAGYTPPRAPPCPPLDHGRENVKSEHAFSHP